MKRYVIAIEEMVSKMFEVFAGSEEEALKIAEENYRKGKFVLDPGELCAKQMAIIFPERQATEWIEF